MYVWICMIELVSKYMYVWLRMYVCICMYGYVCMYVYVCSNWFTFVDIRLSSVLMYSGVAWLVCLIYMIMFSYVIVMMDQVSEFGWLVLWVWLVSLVCLVYCLVLWRIMKYSCLVVWLYSEVFWSIVYLVSCLVGELFSWWVV